MSNSVVVFIMRPRDGRLKRLPFDFDDREDFDRTDLLFIISGLKTFGDVTGELGVRCVDGCPDHGEEVIRDFTSLTVIHF